jgi:hypothetical protein
MYLFQIAEKVKFFFHSYAVNCHKMTVITPAYHTYRYTGNIKIDCCQLQSTILIIKAPSSNDRHPNGNQSVSPVSPSRLPSTIPILCRNKFPMTFKAYEIFRHC